MTKKNVIILILLYLFLVNSTHQLYPQELTINEVMSSNHRTIADEDGDYPDWLELYYRGSAPLQLAGYGLSDDDKVPFKWIFSDLRIAPQEHLLIFASDKDRRRIISHWETAIKQGDTWKYRPGTANIPANWNTFDYNDSAWPSGLSGFGYGDGDDATTVARTVSLYIRKVFNVADLDNIASALLHIDYDDGFVAYLNGVEIARANIGAPGISPSFDQLASSSHEAVMYSGGHPEKFVIDAIRTRLKAGANLLAIQVHNAELNSSDLSLIPFFTLGMYAAPDNPTGWPEILQLQLPLLHTNFKISASGETLLLTQPNGILADRVKVVALPADVSWGRQPDGSAHWWFFSEPTPGALNNKSGYLETAAAPQFSQSGGFYSAALSLRLTSLSANATIYYSLDGTEPDSSAKRYSQPIAIDTTTVVRARVLAPNMMPSKIITHTFFLNSYSHLPVFSLTTAPANLFDPDSGIYMLGKSYQTSNPYYGANFWQDWERPMHVEFFEPGGKPGFRQDAGVKIIGGWSRANPQKPMAIFARSVYGAGEIDYQLFPDRPFTQFEAFILRNGGNDWGRTFFSDGLMHGLVETIDLDVMAFRPSLVYINGVYWGILNLREKQNEHYLAQHHNVDPDSIDLLELNASPIQGDAQHYLRLINFVSYNDLRDSANYAYVKTQMDINNFIDYNVAQIYFDNRDWPGNNIKYWRPRSNDGKWRWLLYDTDWGFGVNAYGRGGNAYVYDYNTLAYATSPQPTPNHHANPPWATLLLRRLLENAEFRHDFINRCADYFNSIFQPSVVTERISILQKLLEPEMTRQLSKWSQSYPLWSRHNLWWHELSQWHANIRILVDFANHRIPFMRGHIIQKFNLAGNALVTLDVTPGTGGFIRINSLVVDKYPWQGNYFMNTPIKVKALPHANFQFSGWTGLNTSHSDSLIITLTGNATLGAVFEPKSTPATLVINEINYHSNANFNPEDWLELYNRNAAAVDLSGWLLTGTEEQHRFYFPNQTKVPAQGYLVLCQNSLAFKYFFPNVSNVVGNLGFGFNSTGSTVRLWDNANRLVDSLRFGRRYPWPLMPDGGGPTLALKNPDLDNTQAQSWAAAKDHGTPGTQNDRFFPLTILPEPGPALQFQLLPNYPNPFNASTTFCFQLPTLASVQISIFNTRGQLVATLAHNNVPAGYHEIHWPAGHLSSGLYFYRITAGSFSATGKCLLLK